jgi:hypothetical protein
MMTPEALAEWQDHPVTKTIARAMKLSLDYQKDAATAAYWAGRAWDETDRKAYLRTAALWEDLFDSDCGEINRILEMKDDK